MGQKLINLYPAAELQRPEQPVQLRLQTRCSSRTRRRSTCASTTTSPTAPRPTCAWPRTTGSVTNARGLWWSASNYALPIADHQRQLGRSVALNVTSVLSPTDHQRVLFSYSKLKLDNRTPTTSNISLAGLGINGYQGFFGAQSPFVPANIILLGPEPRQPVGSAGPAQHLRLQLEPAVLRQLHEGAEHPRR